MSYLIHGVCACPGHGSVDDVLDAENKRLAENLANKVSRLKSVGNNQQLSPSATSLINKSAGL